MGQAFLLCYNHKEKFSGGTIMAENNVNGEIIPEASAPVTEAVAPVVETSAPAVEPVVKPAEPVVDTSAKIEIPKEAVTAPAAVAVPVAPVVAAPAPVVDPKAAKAKSADEKAAKKAKEKAEKAEAKKNKNIEKDAKKAAEIRAKIEQCPKEYKPVSTGKYFWTGVLCYLPIVGLIITIILSIIPRNKNLKNFVRAILIADAICIIVSLIFAIIAVAVGGNKVTDLIWPFTQFVEDMANAMGI